MFSEEFNYNEEELELLREKTHLGFISKLKIYQRKKNYDKYYKLYQDFPNRESTLYLEPPEIIEYDLRLRKWVKLCTSAWEKYLEVENDGYGLDEFSKRALNNYKVKVKGK